MKATMKQIVVATELESSGRHEPTDIEAVIGGGNPFAEIIPRGLTLLS